MVAFVELSGCLCQSLKSRHVLGLLYCGRFHSGVVGAIVNCCVLLKLILCVFISRTLDSWTCCLCAALEFSMLSVSHFHILLKAGGYYA